MKISTTSERLNLLMAEQGLKQVDILKMCQPYCEQFGVKLSKSHLSQYVSGRSEPMQDKLFILAKVFNVDEAWLMGYDVSKTAETSKDTCTIPDEDLKFALWGGDADNITDEMLDDVKKFAEFIRSKKNDEL